MKGTNNSIKVQKIIGSRIRAAREYGNLSRNEFAELLLQSEEYPEIAPRKSSNEISTPAEKLVNRIKQWERGENPVGLEFIPAICDVLHCDVGYLFGDYEEHYRVAADISAYTGLSEINVNRLIIWQDRFNSHLKDVANICIESAFDSLEDYIHLEMARLNMEKFISYKAECTDLPENNFEAYQEVYRHLQTEEKANEYGYALLQHRDAIRFYARSIANALERHLEEVYTNGID